MAGIYEDCTMYRANPQDGLTRLIVDTGTTPGDVDATIVITLGSYGMSTLMGITEHLHTTDGSVVIPPGTGGDGTIGYNNSTTAVSSGVLTITVGTGTNMRHVYEILGR